MSTEYLELQIQNTIDQLRVLKDLFCVNSAVMYNDGRPIIFEDVWTHDTAKEAYNALTDRLSQLILKRKRLEIEKEMKNESHS